jgi:colanic acid/amylovoran biosynthesis glycosyltransferase
VVRVAYLNTEYPSLSHTFIEREIRSVRRHGVEVHSFSIRPSGASGRLGPEHEEAARETVALLAQPWKLLLDALFLLVAHPLGLARAVARSQELACPGPRSRLKHLAYVAEATRLVRELRARDLKHVHVHMANNGAAVALLATEIDRSLTYSLSIHGSAEFFHVDTWRLREKASGASFIRCISNFCRAQVMAWTPEEAWGRMHVVHCGVDPRRYRRSAPPATDRLRMLTVGRLHPIKGYPLLLEACAELSSRGIDWSLDMVGDGPMRGELRGLAERLGIAGRITFSGPVGQDRIQEHFERANVMVMSSFMEGVPVVLMEAMAMELPVVATRVGGVPELVEDGVSGRLVAPGSARELADALAEVSGSIGSLSQWRHAARRTVERQYNTAELGARMASLLERYAERARPEPRLLPKLAHAAYARVGIVLATLACCL